MRLQLDKPLFRPVRSTRCGKSERSAHPILRCSAHKKSRSSQPLIKLTIIHRKRFYASSTSIRKITLQSLDPRSSANFERLSPISEKRREGVVLPQSCGPRRVASAFGFASLTTKQSVPSRVSIAILSLGFGQTGWNTNEGNPPRTRRLKNHYYRSTPGGRGLTSAVDRIAAPIQPLRIFC